MLVTICLCPWLFITDVGQKNWELPPYYVRKHNSNKHTTLPQDTRILIKLRVHNLFFISSYSYMI